MTSTMYQHTEEVNEYDGFIDIFISDVYDEFECLGEVLIDGKPAHADTYTRVETGITFSIFKDTAGEKGLVSGWANVARNADGSIPLDWQGDIIAPDVLEEAAINFMMEYRESGVCHQGDCVGIVVESIVMTKDKQQAMGIPDGIVPEGWFITVKLLDQDIIEEVKNGNYQMFSIQGSGIRVAV